MKTNKKLMAVAVAAALAAPGVVLGQATTSGTNVQIYGLFDMAVRQDKYSDSAATTTTVGGVTTPTAGKMTKFHMHNGALARIGFRGTEALGGGQTAFFQVESGLTLDSKSDINGGGAGAATWGSRPTFIGLRGTQWGEVSVGFQDSPYTDVVFATWSVVPSGAHFGQIMNNGYTTGQGPANQVCSGSQGPGNTAPVAGGPTTANPLCGSEAVGNSTAFWRRVSDAIVYRSPVIAGVRFATMLVATELKQNPNDASRRGQAQQQPGFAAYSLIWSGGPFTVGGAYEQHTSFRAIDTTATAVGTPGVTPNTKDKGLQLGGRYNYGRGLLGVGWEKLTYANSNTAAAANNFDIVNWTVEGTFNVTPADVAAIGYSYTPGATNCGSGFSSTTGTLTGSNTGLAGFAACGGAGKAKEWSLTWDHNFTKRTALYAQYSKIDNSSGSTYYYIVGPTTNNGTGVSGALAAGTDVSTLALGMKHSF